MFCFSSAGQTTKGRCCRGVHIIPSVIGVETQHTCISCRTSVDGGKPQQHLFIDTLVCATSWYTKHQARVSPVSHWYRWP